MSFGEYGGRTSAIVNADFSARLSNTRENVLIVDAAGGGASSHIFTVVGFVGVAGQLFRLTVQNRSGGALGAITWPTGTSAFKFLGASPNPADGADDVRDFVYQSGAWQEVTGNAALTATGTRIVINLAAGTQTLSPNQSGQHFIGAVDAVFTLPLSDANTKGVTYTFVCGALSSGTGLSISPNAADAIYGNGLTATLDKDLINSGASDRLGDSVTIIGSGVAGATAWRITNVVGTWAKEA